MNGITQPYGVGTVLPYAAATPSPAVRVTALPVHAARLRPVWTGVATARTRAGVSRPQGGAAVIPVTGTPVFADDKCTGASVPGRRGGT